MIDDQTQRPPPTRAEHRPTHLPPPDGPAKILFVDDDPRIFDGMLRALRTFQTEFVLRGTHSAQDAIQAMHEWQPTAVVSDVAMPGQSGLDLLAAVSADDALRHIPVIMLTGSGESDLKRKALDRGAVDLLSKPIRAEDLVARLRSAIRLRRYDDHIRTENARLETQVRRRTQELEHAHGEMVLRLAIAGELRDRETAAHVCRVAHASAAIAQELGVPRTTQHHLMQAAALHDIGKIGIPDSILLKPGPLEPHELTIMQQHCRIGWEVLRLDVDTGASLFVNTILLGPHAERPAMAASSVMSLAANIALSHHERWDGTGYPGGLRRDAIPLEARIVAVADVFEALCHARPYKPAHSTDRAVATITEGAGTHFDPDVVAAFLRAVPAVLRVFDRFADPHAPDTRHEPTGPVEPNRPG